MLRTEAFRRVRYDLKWCGLKPPEEKLLKKSYHVDLTYNHNGCYTYIHAVISPVRRSRYHLDKYNIYMTESPYYRSYSFGAGLVHILMQDRMRGDMFKSPKQLKITV